VFSILDGASIDGLPQKLSSSGVSHACLFGGVLDPELEAVMPFLLEMSATAALAQDIVKTGWMANWGVFMAAPKSVTFRDMRQHFRPHLRVRGPMGQMMFFRYYDPRVLRSVLPTFDASQRAAFFGPVDTFFVAAGVADRMIRFDRGGDARGQEVPLDK
jgi:hypothetical protein